MKRSAILIITALAAVLAMGVMVGCSGQSSSSAPAEQTQEEIIAELKDAIAQAPEFKSVTMTETTLATYTVESDDASSESDKLESTSVYKFDKSDGTLKTSTTSTIGNISISYFSEGDEAVCVTDGPVYSGTTEQFNLEQFKGAKSYLQYCFNDPMTIIDCVDTVTKEEQGKKTVYTLTLDPKKYIASDEILTMMADDGDPVVACTYVYEVDENGHIALTKDTVEYGKHTAERSIELSDFDSTVIDPMPAATKTYEEMEADMDAKYAAFE